MATPLAQEEYDRFYDTLGGSPVHNTLAYHWARLVELLYAAERMRRTRSGRRDQRRRTSGRCRPQTPTEGVGVVEAPAGTLIHHYKTDERGIITQGEPHRRDREQRARAIYMSVERAAKGLIKNGKVSDGLLNMVEMAFRAYDPCFACATHSLPGRMPLEVEI